ncbi:MULTISPECIES: NAD(P)-dependent alcohol dehydrogenase [Brachybacterium]|uniref:NAD(P)-dependent alcohol dehydrogenase n=1 Tax=Brachybacterium TaxID=43668 RepID=UPI000BB9753F|nr:MULTISPECIES: NAD(P)-dependent alcohol dehydrogenase [Brachybacterium]PCC31991.1 NAD(P)-dependent alcohol dehydrogenase [Brachybacterium alimentarium]RCS66977.1 NAD(P)-dependent alcohol dehydrogenase [Brachybacterium sp. JB7]RCS71719.1 NAD(P)-dependent alcohol dehydrogenase [Brachybacterium alimentarium]RCS74078.1 NAD(P)-dependent alcohol dehydrogenase [Brachybacterium alimentarium]RCS79838.1 NAD(P)-dependent alcohol dehydrogenase [Brachybacterium alimentarium]
MRALVLQEKNRMSIEEVEPVGSPGPGEVRIAMHTVGICASDVHYWTDGKIGPFVVEEPMVLGHEGSGTVVEVGEGVTDLSPGDRVAMEPGVPNPSSRAVREGNYNVDPDVQFWATPPVDGCLTDEVIHPASYTFKLPDSLSFAEGALIEPFSVGMFAATKAGIKPGDVAAVVGSGTIGIMTAIAARAGGASQVFISDVLPEKLALLDGLEGIIPVDATKEDLGERVRAETGGWGPQVVFEATGAAPAYKSLWSLPAPGGRIVLVGMPVDPVPFDIATAQSRGISLETVFRYANVYQKAIDLAATDAVDLSRFVSETFTFDNAVGAFERFLEGRPTDVKLQITL